jgi:nitronate monooxygenase
MLLERLGLSIPIFQAPMAGSQGSALALATAGAGALGALPAAMLSIDALGRELATLSAATDRAFNVNFFCHEPPRPEPATAARWRAALAPYYAELGLDPAAVSAAPARTPFSAAHVTALAATPPEVVSFHFGLPAPELLAAVRGWGSLVFGCATTVEEARWLEARGVDAIVAQGAEAGGHRGSFASDPRAIASYQIGTMALVRLLTRAVRVPVIAAGGIGDAAGVRAALALGASAVQIGTAFLRAPEATTSAVHRAALEAAADEGAARTALTNLFSGRPARGIENRLMRELGPMSELAPAFPLAADALAPLRAAAEARGDGSFSPLWAGQAAPLAEAKPAAAIVRALAEGAYRANVTSP